MELRYAIRALLRKPLFFAGAVISIGLGIGANTAIFTCVNTLFLRPLPVAEPDRLVEILTTSEAAPGDLLGTSYLNFLDYRQASGVFSDLVLFRPLPLRLNSGGRPEMVRGELVTANFFTVLGVKPMLGRAFLPEEDRRPGAAPVVVLSHSLWQRRFASDPEILGREIQLNGHRFTIVGVAPPKFQGLVILGSPELWTPMSMHPQLFTGELAVWFKARDGLMLNAVGRLRPGVTLERASAAMTNVASRLRTAYPVENKGFGLALVPLVQSTLHYSVRDQFLLAAEVLMVVVGVLLLTACANVANLLLARALERRREIAIRLSLGAGKGHLARQLITEGLVLSLAGGAVGVLIGRWALDALWAFRPPILPDTLDLSLRPGVLIFAFALCLATGLFFGLAPLAQAFNVNLVSALKDVGDPGVRAFRRFGLRQFLVAAQVALSFASLVGAGLFLASVRQAQLISPGFATDNLAFASFDLAAQGYDEARGRDFFRRVLEGVRSLPGVRSVTLASLVPLDFRGTPRNLIEIEGRDAGNQATDLLVRYNTVGPDYFQTLGTAIVKGRGFTPSDRPGSVPAAVINETMAARFWPGQDAVGRRFRFSGESSFFQVVGIAEDCQYEELGAEVPPYIYLPLEQRYDPAMTLQVRTERDPTGILGPLRQSLYSLDPELPLADAQTIGDVMSRSLWASRTAAGLLTLFSLLGLILASVGVYSTMAFAVNHRFRELGIRTALGAGRLDLLFLILKDGLRPVAVGIAAGGLAALFASRKISGLLFGATANFEIFAVAAAVMLAIALTANLLPAWRAMAINPRDALYKP
jgi:predicted permease